MHKFLSSLPMSRLLAAPAAIVALLVLLAMVPQAAATSTSAIIDNLVAETGVPLSRDEQRVLEKGVDLLEKHYLRAIDVEALLGEVFTGLREHDKAEAERTEPAVGDDEPLTRVALALNGALQTLDAHTAYLTPEAEIDMRVRISGEFGGLGLEVTMEDGLVKVVSPIDDTPAERAGMQPGDLISRVDGESIKGMTLRQAVTRMRGLAGTDIRLTVRRQEVADEFDVTITRDRIRIRPVKARAEGSIGYVRISSFNQQADMALKAAVEQLEAEQNGGLRGLVIDLRNNPGGVLSQAVQVADEFLDNGDIVSVRGRYREDARYTAGLGDLMRGKQIVVLINSGSASASEIVAGALKDHRRATLMGSRSFGKGSVQTILPMGRSYGALRLTTQLYYMPNGYTIQAHGVVPDLYVEIERPDDEIAAPRREEDLDNALKGEDENGDTASSLPKLSGKRCQEILPEKQEDQMLACAIAYLRLGGFEQLATTTAVPVAQ